MPKITFTGPLAHRLRSLITLYGIGLQVSLRHAMGRKIAPDWDISIETGIRFWRHQFTKAMAEPDMQQGRQIFDSLLTETDDVYAVETEPTDQPRGQWITPKTQSTKAIALYLHGGGYAFNGPISNRYGAMLAHHTGARLFMPLYRLTPEHPHPAQAEDALAAWHYLRLTHAARNIVVMGDSAGGHMALMLLQTLREQALTQPALCIGLCPWTDIGARGGSLHGNDVYDLVQGWMALRFGAWLDPQNRYGREALSPIFHDYRGLAPIYLQSGAREILHDMIVAFAKDQAAAGADIRLDVWPDMPHNFQAYDSLKPASRAALAGIRHMVAAFVDGADFGDPSMPALQVRTGAFDPTGGPLP